MALRFQFDVEKLVQALAFFAHEGVSDLTKLKAAKLLYFADKYHLLRYGRPVLGDNYACMPYGPVPSKSLNVMNEALTTTEVDNPQRELFLSQLALDRGFLGRDRNPKFRLRGKVNLDVFSKTDIEALTYAVREYGHYKAPQLVNLTHEEATWRIPNQRRLEWSSVDIPYELFFVDSPESRDVLELAEFEQEDRDFGDALRQAARTTAGREQAAQPR